MQSANEGVFVLAEWHWFPEMYSALRKGTKKNQVDTVNLGWMSGERLWANSLWVNRAAVKCYTIAWVRQKERERREGDREREQNKGRERALELFCVLGKTSHLYYHNLYHNNSFKYNCTTDGNRNIIVLAGTPKCQHVAPSRVEMKQCFVDGGEKRKGDKRRKWYWRCLPDCLIIRFLKHIHT